VNPEHYSDGGVLARIVSALTDLGFGDGAIDPRVLAPLDHFHARGIEATSELIRLLGPQAGQSVLDIGCGIGGPARYFAASTGCSVTGIDLTAEFVDVAIHLSERTGISDLTNFMQGDALNLPFPDGSFDAAYTQHVAMNIQNRPLMYQNVHRVLKPSAHFAIYDVIAGNGEPLLFPVPWSRTPSSSFLLSEQEMRGVLAETGFEIVAWSDKSKSALTWISHQTQSSPNPVGLQLILGPDFRSMAQNFAENLRDGRIAVAEVLLQRSQ
jgi:ubiquinone/menaquinone biosynthesis C-methylase UbiE